jgi:nitroreductase
MDVMTAVEARRAVKQFDPDHNMTEEEIRKLMSLVVLSPTAFNIQHWRFVLVRDRGLRENIRAVSWMQPQITDASMLVIICADLKAWERRPERYWHNAPHDVREGVLAAIEEYYRGHEQVQRDEAMRSCGIAAQTMMLAAKALGYDSCPMDLSDLDEVARLINLPEDHAIAMFVAIGKGARDPWPRAGQLPLEEVMQVDRF